MNDPDKNLHANHRERLRDRYDNDGPFSLENHEVLELFLFDCIPRKNTNPIAHRLLNHFKSAYNMFIAPEEELIKVKGVGKKTAQHIKETFEEYRNYFYYEYGQMKMSNFELVSSFLVWHRMIGSEYRRKDEYVTILTLTKEFECVELYDVLEIKADEIIARMDEVGAYQAIVAVGKDFDKSLLKGLREPDDVLLDVITITNGNATSMEFAEGKNNRTII